MISCSLSTPKSLSFFLALFALAFQQVSAQSSVNGRIADAKGEPLPYANVLLLHATDSTMAKGVVTSSNGSFRIENIEAGNFMLVATMVGFKRTTISPLNFEITKNVSLETIVLNEESEQLNEVVVKASRPVFEQRIDRLVVNVENSITSVGGNALEVLERSPGITLNRQSNSINMNGKQGVLVMFDGKIQRLPMETVVQLLGSMPAANIDKIELISNPSSRYDAQGDAGIINIVTKHNPNYGTNGSVNASVAYSYYGKAQGSININHRKKGFAVFADYSISRDKLWQEMTFDRTISNPDQHTLTVSTRYPMRTIHNARLGAEWSLGKSTTMNMLVSGFDNVWDMDAYNDSHITQNNQDSADVKIHDYEINHWKHMMGNVNINHKFTGGQSLNLDVDYLYYHDNNPHLFKNNYTFYEPEGSEVEYVKISKKTPIHMGVTKLDYEFSINKLKIETGLKATFSRLSNAVVVANKEQENWVPDPQFTQNYDMKDDVLAAYVSMNSKVGEKGQLQLGLRTEQTDMSITNGANENIFDLNFWSLFPTAYYSKQVNSNNSFNFSYGRRISRPSYQDIAPFVIFMDPFTYFSGNPKLKPTLTEAVQATYSHKEIVFSLKYSYDKNSIANFQSRVDPEDKKTYFYSENLDKVQTYTLSLSLPISLTKWWRIQSNVLGLVQQINTIYQDVPIEIQQWSVQTNVTQQFTLPRDYAFEVSAFYWSPSRFGIAEVKGFGSVSAGVQKKLNNNRGSLSLNINDIFWTGIYRFSTINSELNQRQLGKLKFAEPRIVRIAYTLNFGKNTVKSGKRGSTASDAEQRRVQ